MSALEFILFVLYKMGQIGVSFSFGLLVIKLLCKICGKSSEVGPSYDALTSIVMKTTIVVLTAEWILTAIF